MLSGNHPMQSTIYSTRVDNWNFKGFYITIAQLDTLVDRKSQNSYSMKSKKIKYLMRLKKKKRTSTKTKKNKKQKSHKARVS